MAHDTPKSLRGGTHNDGVGSSYDHGIEVLSPRAVRRCTDSLREESHTGEADKECGHQDIEKIEESREGRCPPRHAASRRGREQA